MCMKLERLSGQQFLQKGLTLQTCRRLSLVKECNTVKSKHISR